MDRLACVDVPDFRLQILLGRHPHSRSRPVAVVERADPHARARPGTPPGRACGVRWWGEGMGDMLTRGRPSRAGQRKPART